MDYRAEIDGLRAIAVISVILFHAGFDFFGGGYVGVDVFFVISGFLITKIIIKEVSKGTFSLLNFYERRARRILPALYVILLFCTPGALLWLGYHDIKALGESLVAISVFVSNVYFWFQSGYFAPAAEMTPFLHTWSLAIEEQFYFIFPILFLITWKFGYKKQLYLIIPLCILSLVLSHWASEYKPSANFFLLPTRAWELLVGVITAFYISIKGMPKQSTTTQVLSLIGLILVISPVFLFSEVTPFPSLYALVPTLGTAIVIFSSTSSSITTVLLSHPFLVQVGLISYSTYLWHQPILAFGRHAFSDELSVLALLSLCLFAILLGYVSWRWVEKPFRDRNKVSKKVILIFSIGGAISLTTIGLYLSSSIFESRSRNPEIVNGQSGHEHFLDLIKERYTVCQDRELQEKAGIWRGYIRCYQTSEMEPTLALFGESHAEHLFIGMAENLNTELIYLTNSGAPFKGHDRFDYLLNYIADTSTINTVVYSGLWSRWFNLLGSEEFEAGLNSTIEFLLSNNKNVVLIEDVPIFSFDASKCFYTRPFRQPSCDMSLDQYQKQEAYLEVFRKLKKSYAFEQIPLSHLFCKEAKCSMLLSGEFYYRDNDHLNAEGSRLAGSFIVKKSKVLNRYQENE